MAKIAQPDIHLTSDEAERAAWKGGDHRVFLSIIGAVVIASGAIGDWLEHPERWWWLVLGIFIAVLWAFALNATLRVMHSQGWIDSQNWHYRREEHYRRAAREGKN